MNSADTDGSTIRDRSAYDNHGSLTGGGSFGKNGPLGNSVEFDGYNSGSRIELGSDNLLNPNNVTVSAWVYPYDQGGNYSSYNYNYIYSNARDCCNPYNGIDFRIVNGNIDFGICNGDRYSATGGSPSSEVWSHVIGTYDGSTIKVYLNGNQVASNGYTGGVGSPSTYDNYIGGMGHGPDQYILDGKLSNLRVYNRALSQSEVNQLYNFRGGSRSSQGSSVAYDDLILWYPLSEAGATDKSDQNEDGTVNGGTYLSDGGPEGFGAYDQTASDYIQVGPSSNLDNMQGEFAWSIWFKGGSQTANYTRLMDFGDTTLRVWGTSAPFRVWFSTEGSRCGYLAPDDDTLGHEDKEWHHAVVTFYNSGASLYVDGEFKDSISCNGETLDVGYNLGIGSNDNGGSEYIGKISDVRVYSRALSESEAKQLYNPKSTNLDRGLVGHWSMDDSDVSGGTLYDRSAYDNHGTINGSPNQSQSSVIGDSFDFDGSGDHIDTFNLGVDSHSLSCWFYADNIDSNGHSIFSGNSGGNNAYSGFWLDDTAQMYYMLDDQKEGGSSFNELKGSSISTGKWYHLVQTYDGETGATAGYLNGNLDASGSRQPNVTFNDVVYVIGSRSAGDDFYFNGKITDVRVYDRVLSEKEINALYNKRTTTSGNSPSIITEGFESGSTVSSLSENWTVGNGTISSSRQYTGSNSFGSWGGGSVDARWNLFPNGQAQIDEFSYYWIEDSSQTGHQVRLYDSNGDIVQRSETENPQWQLSDGNNNMDTLASPGYNNWTLFSFEFDWAAGTYDYYLEDTIGTLETGTRDLVRSTNVSYIDFVGTNGKYCRFDELKVKL